MPVWIQIIPNASYSNITNQNITTASERKSENTPVETDLTKSNKKKPKLSFASARHEAKHVFGMYRKNLAVQVQKEDFQAAKGKNLNNMDISIVFKGPQCWDVRIVREIRKILRNKGITESRYINVN